MSFNVFLSFPRLLITVSKPVAELRLQRRLLSDKMVKAKKIVIVNEFKDLPKESDFKIEEEELPPLKDGEYTVEASYLSVDPYQRAYTQLIKPGFTMIGGQVGKVIESRNALIPEGKYVFGHFGWRTHTAVTKNLKNPLKMPPYVLPDFQGLPVSLALGVLGMPGNTAYFGFKEVCKSKPGDTVAISGAAGAVGSHVGQIAKIHGCTVIGIAGSDEKCNWLKSLGFDHALNYKTANLQRALSEAAPNGIDCYFDNVGGELSNIVMNNMNLFGRVALCGSISSYNSDSSNIPKVTVVQPILLFHQLTIEAFIVSRWNDRWIEGIKQNIKWIKEGKLKYEETVTEGFENMPKAFIGMLTGKNTGKAIVKV